MRWRTIENLECKSCGKVLGEADFEGVIKKKCPRCSSMNIYFQRLGGKVYRFLEHKEK